MDGNSLLGQKRKLLNDIFAKRLKKAKRKQRFERVKPKTENFIFVKDKSEKKKPKEPIEY